MSNDCGKCRLCGLPVGRSEARLETNGQTHSFCCKGCLYVFQILSNRPAASPPDFRQSDLFRAALSEGVVSAGADLRVPAEGEGIYPEELVRETYFRIEGMSCTACSFLVEEVLRGVQGILEARVFFASDLVWIRYVPHLTGPQEAMEKIGRLGYSPFLLEEDIRRKAEKRSMLVRVCVSSILSMNIMGISFVLYAGFFRDLGKEPIAWISLPVWIMSTIVLLYGGAPILGRAWRGLLHGTASMDTLISLGSVSAYLYSLLRMAQGSVHLYFDTAAMLITLVLLGRAVEGHARDRVTLGIHELYNLARQKVRLSAKGREEWELPVAVHRGDLFEARKGERTAVDGRLLSERTNLDESFLTGESRPVTRIRGELVSAGSLILGEDAELEAVSDGSASTLHQMMSLLQEALARKNPSEVLADRITRRAVPAVLLLAIATALFLPLLDIPWGESLLRAVTVLVITCPCALGIATPLARVASLGTARSRGILVASPDAMESATDLQVMILDKTGTVTEGRFALRCMLMDGLSREEGLMLAASVESRSQHFIAREILEQASALSVEWCECSGFNSFEGLGVGGVVQGKEVLVGNPSLFQLKGWTIPERMEQKAVELEQEGQTVVFLGFDGKAWGILTLGDALREDALEVIPRLRSRGMEVWLVSGDSPRTTEAFAGTMKVDRHVGGALPADKVEIIRSLQATGKRVGMVGDGVNDAAALAQANVGFALGPEGNLLRSASDVTILPRDLHKVLDTMDLAAFTSRVVRQNLFFSFFYNALGIPLAVAGFLNPVVASIAMFASSLTVIGNTIRITGRKPEIRGRSSEVTK